MLEQIAEMSMLYDFYGELLPKRQQEIFRLYHEDNLSLAEIGEEMQITRQGVHEAVKRSEEKLSEFELKLGLVKRFLKTEQAIKHISQIIDRLSEKNGGDRIDPDLLEIRRIIKELE